MLRVQFKNVPFPMLLGFVIQKSHRTYLFEFLEKSILSFVVMSTHILFLKLFSVINLADFGKLSEEFQIIFEAFPRILSSPLSNK